VLTIALDRRVRVLRVTAFSERRGSAAVARTLYEDISGEPLSVLDATALRG
jgi:ribosome-associated heat shock protein Hsp15